MLRRPAGFGHHRHGVMPAHIEERAQPIVATSHYHDWLAGDRGSNKLPGLLHLVSSADSLPGPRENALLLERCYSRVCVPRRRNRVSLSQRRFVVVARQNLFERLLHLDSTSLDEMSMLSPRAPARHRLLRFHRGHAPASSVTLSTW